MNSTQQLTGIEIPSDNDVPLGRGGFINSHSGHRRYLKMVQDRQLDYVTCQKSQKTKIAWSIVRDLRALNPPARFLQKDSSTGLWHDVGDKRFREKVSQALREHQPFIKAVIDYDDDQPSEQPSQAKNYDTEPMDLVDSLDSHPMSTGFTDLMETENRRKTFLSNSTHESGTGFSDVDELEQDPAEFRGLSLMSGLSLGDFSVSQGPSMSSFHSYPPLEKQSGHRENLMEESMAAAFKIGLDFPESFGTSSRVVSEQTNHLLDFPEDGLEHQKIDFLALLDMPHPSPNARVLSNSSSTSSAALLRCL